MRFALRTAAAMLLAATPLVAQEAEHPHRGFWIGFGFGVGQNTSTGLDGGRLVGGTGYLRMGGTPKQSLLIGAEGISWVNEDDVRGNFTATLIGYPSRDGFFVKGGIGFASVGRSTTTGNTTTSTTVGGFGLTTGLGYDIRLGRNIYLVPELHFLVQLFSEQNDPVLGTIPGTNTLLLGTLGLTWH